MVGGQRASEVRGSDARAAAGRGRSLVAGAGGFIGGHLTERLLARGERVRCVDIKPLEDWHQRHPQADNGSLDLAVPAHAATALDGVTDVYHLASDMGGMGFIAANDLACLATVRITLALAEAAAAAGVERFLFASSACVYPAAKQTKAGYRLKESDAIPAHPPEGYGWEKLYGETLLAAHAEAGHFAVRLPRLHNVYGSSGVWRGGREKAPAAISRKVCVARRLRAPEVRIWGTGRQSRSFCHIDDCVPALLALMASSWSDPINIGSDEAITTNGLAQLVAELRGWPVTIRNDPRGPAGVEHRNADISLAREQLGWEPRVTLRDGLDALSRDIEALIADLDDAQLPALSG
jgi:nucleoside-diphosphate-sugar epimerase